MTKAKKATKRRRSQSASKAMLDAVPSNWCDTLLTGPKAVIGSPPYDCRDIERLLNAVREQVRRASNIHFLNDMGPLVPEPRNKP